ncbi:MAG: 3-deoxy-7-phosphoheptulonate synthase class II [Spirochaetes bacterium]|nr:3-deoxy-7-phosphoheptulonate synthase class II [Spirochaetota bacterium]
MVIKSQPWSPDSWQRKTAQQQPNYPDRIKLDAAIAQLASLPPLVTSFEIELLRQQLAEAARGERFLLQGGDCSENFSDCESDAISSKLKILLQMSLVIVQGGKKRVIRIGRFAGQYAKPRSSDMETRNGVTLPSYRGDMINGMEFTPESRIPDPELLLRGYEHAGLTLNFIRALIDGGFADLHHPELWRLGFVHNSPLMNEYTRMVDSIGESLRFMETLTGGSLGDSSRVDFFTSHEGLHLLYEQAHTRRVPRRTGWYNLTTHLPWIGNRTRALDGAHIEYFRGIENPIGVKIDAATPPGEVCELCSVLNPDNIPGKLTFIMRFGAKHIAAALPPIADAVIKSGAKVLWCSDPMHGNTETTASGIKTRRFDNVLNELEHAFSILSDAGTHLGGVHFELTGDDVTECIGGASGITEADLSRDYRTQVDPRLNYEQSLEMALLLSRLMARK